MNFSESIVEDTALGWLEAPGCALLHGPKEIGDRYPVLSYRRNIRVIADETHRSQYDFIDGLPATCKTRC